MSTTTVRADWERGFDSLADEHIDPLRLDLEGAWPQDLHGTLYRMGPASFEGYRHWFDGDGMAHAFVISPTEVHYRNRFVQTAKRAEEVDAGRRIGPAFGTPPAGSMVQRLRHARPKSAANTNVVYHAGRLLALWEQGWPYVLDPDTLATVGEDDLDRALAPGDTYSAHPHRHLDGDLWNFGVRYGRQTVVGLTRTTPAGETQVVTRRRLPWPAMVHDMAVSDRHVVVLVPPLVLPRLPLGLISGSVSYADSLRWRPQLGTVALVYDIGADEWREHRTSEPLMFFHLVGARSDGESLWVDVCAGRDRGPFDTVSGYTRGQVGQMGTRLVRLQLEPGERVTVTDLSDALFELPSTATRAEDDWWVWGVGPTANGFIGRPVRIDPESGHSVRIPVAAGQYAGECIPAGRWILTLVLDTSADRSELWVLDGHDPTAGPVAIAHLPHVVPFGFHGCWRPSRPTTR